MSTPPFFRKVLITGESSAIGLEACRRYLSAGHSVVAHYFEDRASLTDEFPLEPRLKLAQCDLADLNAASELAQTHTNWDIAVFLASLAKSSNL